jgi:C_GCAxxG_C_C family probable redox protein
MTELEAFIKKRVHDYYWRDDINCATATLKILSEKFQLPLRRQVLDAAVGMHGAGEYGAQCGLLEGGLMFLGILGRCQGLETAHIVKTCRDLAHQFEKKFGSLSCAVLRPLGFSPENPPHLCEDLTCDAIVFDIQFVEKQPAFLSSINSSGRSGSLKAGSPR